MQSWSKKEGYMMHGNEYVGNNALQSPHYVSLSGGATMIFGLGGSLSYVKDSYGNKAISVSFGSNLGLGAGLSFEGGNIRSVGKQSPFHILDNEGGSAGYNVNVGPLGIASESHTVNKFNSNIFRVPFNKKHSNGKYSYSGTFIDATEVILKPKLEILTRIEATMEDRSTWSIFTWN